MDHTSSALFTLADRLTAVETKVSDLARPQLANSSIVDGAIDQVKLVDTGETDENGFPIFAEEVVARLGEQEDGGNGVSVFNGPVPPRPVNFSVVGGPGLLTIEWLGEFEDRYEPYSDHAYVNVHVSTVPDFTPDASTIKAAILSPQGEQVTISGLDPAPYYVTLVAVSQAGIWSLPAPFDGDDTTAQVDPVWVQSIEAKADEAKATADSAKTTAEQAGFDASQARKDASAAMDKAVTAQADATAAMTAANGKSTIFYSTSDPDPTKGVDGDTWYKRTATSFGTITGAWEKRSGLWESRALTDQVIDSISAGKITSGTLGVGQVITVGTPTDGGSYLRIGNSSLTTYRQDVEGNWVPALQLGGANDPSDPTTIDQIRLIDPVTGEVMVGMDASGVAWASSMVTEEISIGGRNFGNIIDPTKEDIIWAFPRGQVAGYLLRDDSVNIGTAECGIAELSFDTITGRMFRVLFDGAMNTSAALTVQMLFRYTTDGTAPTVSSKILSLGAFNVGAGGTWRQHLEGYLYSGEDNIRVLLSARVVGGSGTVKHLAAGTSYLTATDMGPLLQGGGTYDDIWNSGMMTLGGGSAASTGTGTTTTSPTATKKTYTKTYAASWSRTWSGSGSPLSGTEIRQGYSGTYGQMKSAIGFPTQLQSDLLSSSVSKVEVYLYANHWYYNNGGTLRIGVHGASGASAPSSMPSFSGGMSATWTAKTGGKWVTLPSSWYPYFANGSNKGIFIGGDATSSNTYYARLNGYGMSYAPKLRVTYTK